MRTLLVIACLAVPVHITHAQDIYKWEDEKGVIHYGDKPPKPNAAPFIKDTAPFSTSGEQLDSATTPELPAAPRGKKERGRLSMLPAPSLNQPKAWVEYPSKNFWISGTLRNGGRGICDTPTVEVAMIDELGRVAERFEVVATPGDINKGEDAQFAGNRSAPLGKTLTWEATPRCNSSIGAIYGARKRGSLQIPHSRIVPSKKLKTRH